MHKLFKSVIWPAIAGNVAWSFVSVAVAEDLSSHQAIVRLIALGLLAAYLMISLAWKPTRRVTNPCFYYPLDSLFAISIAVFAIATYNESTKTANWVSYSLVAVFTLPMLGHLFKIWEPGRICIERLCLALPSTLGIAILVVGLWAFPQSVLEFRVLALLVVIEIWILIRSLYPNH